MEILESKTIELPNGERIEFQKHKNGLYSLRRSRPKVKNNGEYELIEEGAIEKSTYDQCDAIAIKHTTV